MWGVLVARLGPITEWPAHLIQFGCSCVWTCMGGSWRRFVHAFKQYPWRFGGLVSDSMSNDAKQELSHEFWNAPECCLDPYFSLRLRQRLVNRDRLFNDDIQSFLKAVFDFCLASTFHLEVTFAHLRKQELLAMRPVSCEVLGPAMSWES